ncbi:hypothetical protein TPHA_0H02330 [Tetrapisispora phaffii CBS 4417]|uniref:Uncharacterized protein n=1 Tax=Tetrapisispora phaffii (strain ATCC 24235 / CBS 4417 / NBRC 1672 / NRRL Y-8282 / UCD 70-5) TaxID=1071381 RepID=G8BWI6_TETPH|nr:hypothetical protein TPHA_0H02330 [Tetrapisispora phaffii CBS 4417]CCE64437.1 hypothetical protein TPHA_0H02330 [Tetrapisispora phaffii CBS 4417]
MMSLDELLGAIYVLVWSISMYTPIITNWRFKSSAAISVDFLMLNIVGYMLLTASMYLQLYSWLPVSEELNKLDNINNTEYIPRPKITEFDLFYTFHGFLLNIVLATQVYFPRLWKFRVEKTSEMKLLYSRILSATLILFSFATGHFIYYNDNNGWSNVRTLSYCNKLFALKLVMSLVKYLPQVKHNFERKSMKGFSISGTFLDAIGGIASLLQLCLQLYNDEGFSVKLMVTNFGKIGLGIITLIFDFIFLTQWNLYKESDIQTTKNIEGSDYRQNDDFKIQ